MKKHILALTILLSFVACDSKEVVFSMTIIGEFDAEKMVNLRTGKTQVLNQRLTITDSTISINNGQRSSKIAYPKTIDKNAKEDKKIIQGYDSVLKINKSIRIVYVGWWNNADVNTIIASPIMIGDYEAKNDTVDVYYTRLK
jgi:hypothetical protein